MHASRGPGEDALYRVGGGIVQFRVHREISNVKRCIWEVSDDQRGANCDGAGFYDVHCSPEAHVLVWRTGIPVDPVDAEVFFRRCRGFDGEDICFAGNDECR